MTAAEIAARIGATFVAAPDTAREVESYYAGDFLSNVMGHAGADSCWLTVMANVNVAGVAVLADVSLVVVCEGHTPDPALVTRCIEQGINLAVTDLPVYEAAVRTV